MRIIFCDNLLDKRVDPDFEEEYNSAATHNFSTDLISYEELSRSNIGQATLRVRESENNELAIYRGWMLPPTKYNLLYEALLKKKIQLIKYSGRIHELSLFAGIISIYKRANPADYLAGGNVGNRLLTNLSSCRSLQRRRHYS